MNSYIYTGTELSLVIDSVPYTIDNSHPRFSNILDCIKENRWDEIVDMISVAKALQAFGSGKVVVDEDAGVVLYNGEVLHNSLTGRIVQMMQEGFSVEPFVKFVENLMSNPSKRTIDELYTFLEYGKLPITEDGCFLAYKRVRENYTDCHSGTFDNSVGKTCSMERNKVDDRSENTCSSGLHFCSLEYLKSFYGERIVILKINPRDVVSIPVDYNNTKGRCCSYVVVGEYKGAMTDPAFTKSVFLGAEDGSDDLQMDDHLFDHEFDTEDDGEGVSQDYIEGYVKGHKAGRNREYPAIEVQNLADGEPYEGSDYGWGYVDGYKDGKGHKARRYTI